MTFFIRLTDIVQCNLTALLQNVNDPQTMINEIILEMEEGLAGARRSVDTAAKNATRLGEEIDQLRGQVASWRAAARKALEAGKEEEARRSLARKQEAEDVAAGLEQEYAAAVATRDHLETMSRALHARLADARRKQAALAGDPVASDIEPSLTHEKADGPRNHAIEEELASLKRELHENR